MTNRVKERRLAAQAAAGLPSKKERRELGRQAAVRRESARRRRMLMRNVGPVLIAVAVIAIIVVAVKLTSGGGTTTAGATPSASAPAPITAPTDAALNTKPAVAKGGTTPVKELKVTTLVQGTGPAVTAGETITVNYVGTKYSTGAEFESSWNDGATASFPIGIGKVIQGWDKGLVGVKIGSRVQLDIPSAMAYGDGTGPTNGDLRFVVDILSATPPAS